MTFEHPEDLSPLIGSDNVYGMNKAFIDAYHLSYKHPNEFEFIEHGNGLALKRIADGEIIFYTADQNEMATIRERMFKR